MMPYRHLLSIAITPTSQRILERDVNNDEHDKRGALHYHSANGNNINQRVYGNNIPVYQHVLGNKFPVSINY